MPWAENANSMVVILSTCEWSVCVGYNWKNPLLSIPKARIGGFQAGCKDAPVCEIPWNHWLSDGV